MDMILREFIRGTLNKIITEDVSPVQYPKEFTAKGGNKIVDTQGNPLILYHGTHANFTEFDPSFDYDDIPDGIGQVRDYEIPSGVVFLSDNEKRVKAYGGKVVAVIVKAKRLLKVDAGDESPDQFFDNDYNWVGKIWPKFEGGGYDALEISGRTPASGKTKIYVTYPELIKIIGNR